MYPRLFFILSFLLIVFTGCASNPAPKQVPEHLRFSTRQLNKGTQFYNKGCFASAARHFQAALERFSLADDLKGAAESLNGLANAYYKLNDMDSAVLVYSEAEALYAILDNKMGRVRALTNKSIALASSEKLLASEQTLNHADRLAKQTDILKASRLKARAILKLKNQDTDESQKLLSEALSIISPTDDRQFASTQYAMGYLLLAVHKPGKAQKHLYKALKADRLSGDYFGISQDLEAIGDSHFLSEQYAQAVIFYKRSIKIYALLDNSQKVQQVSIKLTDSASKTDANIQATMHWATQWLAGKRETSICR